MQESELKEGELPAPLQGLKTCAHCRKGRVCIMLTAHVQFMTGAFGPKPETWPVQPEHLGLTCMEGPNYEVDIREADVIASVLERARAAEMKK